MQHTNTERPRPWWALPVRNLPISYAFYTELLGFGTTATPLPDHLVEVTDFGGDPLLLIGRQASDVTEYLNNPHTIMKPGNTLGFFCQDLDAQFAEWSKLGLTEIEENTAPLGDRALLIRDPDGNTLRFTTPRQWAPEEIVALYAQGPARLQQALADISEQELDKKRSEGEWTIRQLVHHIVDGDDLWMHAVKAALARSGSQYRHDWYTPDNTCAETLDYAGRTIEPALLLFQANHEHILQLVQHLPDALSRFLLFAGPDQEPHPFTVQQILYRRRARKPRPFMAGMNRRSLFAAWGAWVGTLDHPMPDRYQAPSE
ncbi:DinB family protein [Dictyobacter aurantiacus]|uniref:VOC domain-containing protein n=1 Tax=Dictyobacter aurantiacus TaxID=1936993 RepID=A0A401ZQI4_9CHLR|nr:DinB family protein [Dictyobacter aurantiacus]GCE09131.1 hypothetical protein KDAU_64600 [Dictyobacter aurantiacus]